MPCYPALALLSGFGDGGGGRLDSPWHARAIRGLGVCWGWYAHSVFSDPEHVPRRETFPQALSQHPGAYTLSLGTCRISPWRPSPIFGLPLLVAAIAFCWARSEL